MPEAAEGFVLPMALNNFHYPHPDLPIDDFLPEPTPQPIAANGWHRTASRATASIVRLHPGLNRDPGRRRRWQSPRELLDIFARAAGT